MAKKKDDSKLLKFPCQFPIKVVGHNNFEFEALVVTTVRKFCPDLSEAAVKTRPSRDDKFLAVTVTVTATSQQQLDDIYTALSQDKRVIMAL